ncbi:MAG TPA: ArsA-related P-loop ATPase [Acidimicrobiia bacterium]|nr:ArsA-related P-loop ATPase [Acidimicrobiia bacterium]
MNGPSPELFDRRLLLFTGKGGVGKSTTAAAAALLASNIGKRVLLVEVDAKGDVPAQFEHGPVGFTPKEIHPGILAMAMDTEASLQEYLKLNLRVPVIGRLGPLAHVLDFVATAAPGVKEILTIGKIAWEVRESIEGRADFDLVVVDASATGHIVAQLGASDAIRDLVDVGPLRSQTQWVSELLADPSITAVNVVTTPEEMPVAETIELVANIRREVKVPLGSVIVNRVLPELFTQTDEETFEALRAPAPSQLLTARVGAGATEVLDAARLAVSMRRTRAAHLEYLQRSVDLPLLYIPYLFVRAHGLRVTRMVADALGAELGL